MLRTTTISPGEELVNLYLANLDLITEGSSEVLNHHRGEAIQNFMLLGLPGKRSENYKYSHIEPLFSADYEKYFTPRSVSFMVEDIFRCDIPELDTHLAITLNGFYFANSEKLTTLEGGAIVGSLAEASRQYPNLVAKNYNTHADNGSEGLVSLNTAFAQDGIFIYIPKGVVLEKPIQIINLLMSDENLMVQYRNLIILEESSSANVVVCDHTLSAKRYLSNVVTEIIANPNSSLQFVKMQNEHNDSTQLSHVYIRQLRGSKVTSNTISLHGGFIRNNLNVLLNEEGCECNAYGLYLTDRTQHIDNYSFIDHAKPNCTSHELFKGVLDDQATGAFTGRILVRKDAQKTLAYQSNNNLLLTPDAKISSKPQLEIYADDVKCSHGATVGQLDLEAKFYMQSRGVSERDAKLMLMFGFAHEVIKRISIEPLRERIDDLVNRRLHGELSRCQSCPMHCC